MSDEKNSEQTVPYARFSKKVAEASELKEQLAALQKQVTEMGQATQQVEQWQTKYAELEHSYNSDKAAFTTKETLYQRGITDPEHMDLAQYRFNKSGSENFSDWLESGIQNDPILSTILNPKTPPPVIQEQTPSEAPAETEPVQQTNTASFPTGNNGVKPAPPSRGELTPETVQNMSVEEKAQIYPKLAEQWGFASVNLRK